MLRNARMEKILAKMEKVRMEKFLAKMEKIIVSLRYVLVCTCCTGMARAMNVLV